MYIALTYYLNVFIYLFHSSGLFEQTDEYELVDKKHIESGNVKHTMYMINLPNINTAVVEI